jgi:hypothetical protein
LTGKQPEVMKSGTARQLGAIPQSPITPETCLKEPYELSCTKPVSLQMSSFNANSGKKGCKAPSGYTPSYSS